MGDPVADLSSVGASVSATATDGDELGEKVSAARVGLFVFVGEKVGLKVLLTGDSEGGTTGDNDMEGAFVDPNFVG